MYQEQEDPSLYVRFPLLERPGESLVVWTTTPWTLPANVAAAVKPDAEYGRREKGEWVAVAASRRATFEAAPSEKSSWVFATAGRSTTSALAARSSTG